MKYFAVQHFFDNDKKISSHMNDFGPFLNKKEAEDVMIAWGFRVEGEKITHDNPLASGWIEEV